MLPGDLQLGRRDKPQNARGAGPHALRSHHPHCERPAGVRGVREPQPQPGLLPGPTDPLAGGARGARGQDLLAQVDWPNFIL
jgi:hypothetical protein